MFKKFLIVSLFIILVGCGDYDKKTLEIGEYVYPVGLQSQCDSQTLFGNPGATDNETTVNGIRYNIRTPSNYDAKFAHPLLMVYAPGGRSRLASERFSGLTHMATSAGFIVGYADSRQLSIPVIKELGTIPGLIAEKWCVDEKQIFLTGHSDGGTASTALAFMETTKHIPAAIAPSAAGINGKEIAEFPCPEPISVMVMQNTDDSYFPGLGSQTVNWWANCNQCEETPVNEAKSGCARYENCANGVTTIFCEKPGTHSDWPPLNQVILDFFRSSVEVQSE